MLNLSLSLSDQIDKTYQDSQPVKYTIGMHARVEAESWEAFVVGVDILCATSGIPHASLAIQDCMCLIGHPASNGLRYFVFSQPSTCNLHSYASETFNS